MEGDDIELHYKKNKKKRRCRCITAIVIILVLFAVGIIIGYFIGKMHSRDKHKRSQPSASTSEAARKEIRQNLRDLIDAEKISDNSRFVSFVNWRYCLQLATFGNRLHRKRSLETNSIFS